MSFNLNTSGFVIQPRLEFENVRSQMIYQYLVAEAYFATSGSMEVGQAIISLSQLERDTGWTRRMIKLSLDQLKEQGYIQQITLPQKRGLLITLIDYKLFQKTTYYDKNKRKNVQENEQAMNKQCTSNEQENEQEESSAKSNSSKRETAFKNDDVQENEQAMNKQCTSDEQENEHLLYITSFITSLNNINNNKTLKDYLESANVKSMNLSSTEEIETFVDFALRTNAFPKGVSKKILINYFDAIRMTRTTCRISAKLLANEIEKMSKYSANQINYAMWMHCDKHDDKKEAYTLGILRNTKEPEARRGLLMLKNQNGGVSLESEQSNHESKYDYGF